MSDIFCLKVVNIVYFFRWEDAKRAYLKFIDNEIITSHITRNPCTLRYTYSYTLIYTKHIEYIQNYRLLHKKQLTQNNNTIHSKFDIHTEKTPTFIPVSP